MSARDGSSSQCPHPVSWRSIVATCLLFGAVTAIATADDLSSAAPVLFDSTSAGMNCTSTGCTSDGCNIGDSDLFTRTKLLGDLGGARSDLAASGITFDISSTQYYQGVTSGGIKRDFRFDGRGDYYMNVDGEKAGLWRGFFVTMHGETRYGEGINFNSGAIMPVNTGALFPQPVGSVTALTAVKFTQALSENFVTFAGKINMLDELKQNYAAGRGVDNFMNLGLTIPVAVGRTVPYSTLGAGFAILRDRQPAFTFLVLDTNNTPTTSGFQSFFNNGATMLSRLETPVTLFDRPGHQAIWGTYSTGTYSDLSPTPYFDPEYGLRIASGTQTGSWSIVYSADQALYVDPSNPQRHWGLFTNIGLADNGPSPVRWSANVGLGGSSPLTSRPLDTFGVGYSYVNYSTPVQQLAPIFLPIGNDQVVEMFYNIAITPWFHLTPDFQVVMPALQQTLPLPPGPQQIDTAVVVGVRAKIDF